jgi:hypothetical protein
MRKGDVYVHADVQGASSCIIKNHMFSPSEIIEEQKTSIPPQTLHEAGMMTVCRSSAWDAKIVANAYWVHAHQVSKSAPTGEYLPTGSFMIRGKKNYLPPNQLVMGLAVMFKLEDESISNHIGERQRRDLNSVDNAESVKSMNSENTWEVSTISDADAERPDSLNEDEQVQTSFDNLDKHLEEEGTSNLEEIEEEQKNGENGKQEKNNDTKKKSLEDNLPDEDSDEQKQQDELSSPQLKKGKKGLSAKDKRKLKQLIKKGIDEQKAKEMLINQEVPEELIGEQLKQKKENAVGKSELTHKPKGMKKGKWKKLRKYADQDEEERKLRMELIGHKYITKEERQKQIEEEQKKKQEELERQRIENEKKRKEREEIKKLMEEENIQYMDEDDLKKLSEIDTLTGQPRDDDIILFAIPVCAPYISLKNYKYKVKLVPGNMKRGKAGQQAMNILIHEAKDNLREQNLLKAITESEITAAMVGNCRIATAVSKIQKTQQSNRKKK